MIEIGGKIIVAIRYNNYEIKKYFLITHNQQVDPIIEIIFTHKSQEN